VSLAVSILVAASAVAGLAFAVVRVTALRRRTARVADGAAELERGNYAHRIILPGRDEASAIADSLNHIADAIQAERDAAARRESARRRLLTDVSHDLRTPITSIAGYVDALQRGLGDDPDRYLRVVAQKAEELARLTDDLFYATRLDADELTLATGPVDLAEIVRQTVLGFEPQLARHTVTLAIPDARCVVSADESALRRVLGNLIGNSVRHADGMTRFGVEMADEGASWHVTVHNDGADLGPDPDALFERGTSGRGGTGLGLAIARELAERMGATVTGESAPGGGARFTLLFPKPASPEFNVS
jgi:signal transduction histidine kinase